jgi:hypothetical protein
MLRPVSLNDAFDAMLMSRLHGRHFPRDLTPTTNAGYCWRAGPSGRREMNNTNRIIAYLMTEVPDARVATQPSRMASRLTQCSAIRLGYFLKM